MKKHGSMRRTRFDTGFDIVATILLVLAQVFAVFIVLFGSAAIQSTLVKQKVLDEHQRNFTINFLFLL